MAHAVVLFLLLLITEHVAEAAPAPSGSEHESCKIWDQLARQLTTSTGTQQVCHSNGSDPCTRIDCSGAYEYNTENTGSIFNLGSKTFEVDYCFGVILNHCDRNISLDFYMQVPNKQVDQTTRVYHNTLLSIPGLSYSSNSSRGISAQGYLYFQMKRHLNSVTFSVTVKVRMKFARLVYWPDELQRRLIRNETVPVPPCDRSAANITTTIPAISQCTPLHWKEDKSPARGKVSGDLGKKCHEADLCSRDPWLVCDLQTNLCVCGGDFEPVNSTDTGLQMCQPKIRHGMPCRSHDECNLAMSERCLNHSCQCQEGDVFNKLLQTCEPKQNERRPVTSGPHLETDSPHKNKGQWPPGASGMPHVEPLPAETPGEEKTGQNKAAIIVASVVGGLVVLGGILLVAYFAIRRLRRPYHNRELLLEGEDSDGIM